LIGLCILLSLSSTWELELSRGPANGACEKDIVHEETTVKTDGSMRGLGQTDAIESVTFKHEEGNEGEKNGVKRRNGGLFGGKLLKRKGHV
jgi:hypothetical protein